MHISEGVLSPPLLLGGWALTLACLTIALRRLPLVKIPEVAVLTSAFFIASLIHVPIGPTSAHLVLNGLAGLLLGWNVFVVVFLGLAMQALFFQYGGLTVLGVNTFNLGLPALLSHYLFRGLLIPNNSKKLFVAGFGAGFFSLLVSGLLVALSLYFTRQEFLTLGSLFFGAHLPIALAEGLITGFVLTFLGKAKPEVLRNGPAS